MSDLVGREGFGGYMVGDWVDNQVIVNSFVDCGDYSPCP